MWNGSGELLWGVREENLDNRDWQKLSGESRVRSVQRRMKREICGPCRRPFSSQGSQEALGEMERAEI